MADTCLAKGLIMVNNGSLMVTYDSSGWQIAINQPLITMNITSLAVTNQQCLLHTGRLMAIG